MNNDASLPILGIAGSLRAASHNRTLLRAASSLTPESVRITVFDQLDEVPIFSEDREHPPPPGVAALRSAVGASAGVLIATPEYNRSVPGVVKNMIDWLSRAEPGLAGRPVAVTGATTGPWGTRISQVTLQQMLISAGALVMPGSSLFVPSADTVFDDTGRLIDAAVSARLEELVAAFARWIRIVSEFSGG